VEAKNSQETSSQIMAYICTCAF